MTHARERLSALLRAAVRVLRPVERDHTDNPPPGGYFANGEWRDPEPRRNYNVDPSTLLRTVVGSDAFALGVLMAFIFSVLAAFPAGGQTPADGTAVAPRRSSLHLQGEPDVPRGIVAVRIINHTDCQIAIRLRRDGVTLGTAAVPVHDGRAIHAKPDTSAMEVEVVADPRLCAPAPAEQPALRPSPRAIRYPVAPVSAPSRSAASLSSSAASRAAFLSPSMYARAAAGFARGSVASRCSIIFVSTRRSSACWRSIAISAVSDVIRSSLFVASRR